ncbi:MAG TPA: triose-phosphate isomerase [Acidimicrobiia bacterium]|nr:triose-phosphate isomerase [Acidimicrobiia bacterium]
MTDRKDLICGNWKMNSNHLEAIQMIQKLHYRLEVEDYDRVDVVVAPPFTALRSAQTVIEVDRMRIGLGAQNVFWEDSGAYTGEVSAPMLAKLNVSYVIVGHSERREHFHESDEVVNRKLKAVLRHGMTPILCVGETLEQREAGQAAEVVVGQFRGAVSGIESDAVASMAIAYEPIWAIGTGRTATPDDAGEMCETIRNEAGELAGSAAFEATRILYGGSVNPGNVKSLMAKRHIDGALVGGASLDPDQFAAVVRYWI